MIQTSTSLKYEPSSKGSLACLDETTGAFVTELSEVRLYLSRRKDRNVSMGQSLARTPTGSNPAPHARRIPLANQEGAAKCKGLVPDNTGQHQTFTVFCMSHSGSTAVCEDWPDVGLRKSGAGPPQNPTPHTQIRHPKHRARNTKHDSLKTMPETTNSVQNPGGACTVRTEAFASTRAPSASVMRTCLWGLRLKSSLPPFTSAIRPSQKRAAWWALGVWA